MLEIDVKAGLEDFSGSYTAGGVGATAGGGAGATIMKNQNGVVIELTSTTQGASLKLAASGIRLTLEKKSPAISHAEDDAMRSDRTAAGVRTADLPRTDELLERYGCGPVRFTGTDDALYERRLVFDTVAGSPPGRRARRTWTRSTRRVSEAPCTWTRS